MIFKREKQKQKQTKNKTKQEKPQAQRICVINDLISTVHDLLKFEIASVSHDLCLLNFFKLD